MSTETKTPYWQLLKDPRWQKKRLEILNRDGFCCKNCRNSRQELHVHHRYYVSGRKPWEYPNVAYMTLCATCHGAAKTADNTEQQWEGLLDFFEKKAPGHYLRRTIQEFALAANLTPTKFLNTLVNAVRCGQITKPLFDAWRVDQSQIQRGRRKERRKMGYYVQLGLSKDWRQPKKGEK